MAHPEKAAPRIDWGFLIADMETRDLPSSGTPRPDGGKAWVEQTELRDRLLEVNRNLAEIVSRDLTAVENPFAISSPFGVHPVDVGCVRRKPLTNLHPVAESHRVAVTWRRARWKAAGSAANGEAARTTASAPSSRTGLPEVEVT